MKPANAPVRIAGARIGSVTWRKTLNGLAPDTRAASSNEESSWRRAGASSTTMIGMDEVRTCTHKMPATE